MLEAIVGAALEEAIGGQREIGHEYTGPFWDILVRGRVLAYLCSHILAFDVQVHRGVLQICSAGAGTAHRMPEGVEYLHCVQAHASYSGQIGNDAFPPRADLYSESNEGPVWGTLTRSHRLERPVSTQLRHWPRGFGASATSDCGRSPRSGAANRLAAASVNRTRSS